MVPGREVLISPANYSPNEIDILDDSSLFGMEEVNLFSSQNYLVNPSFDEHLYPKENFSVNSGADINVSPSPSVVSSLVNDILGPDCDLKND